MITQQYINADVSRSGLTRLLKREDMSRLEDVIPRGEGETLQAKKTFNDYEPGFVHIDIKYLPQMPDETSRRYLFVAIDRATRWVFLHIYLFWPLNEEWTLYFDNGRLGTDASPP
jgi:hypothetical protein